MSAQASAAALGLALAAGWLLPWTPRLPTKVERWLYNPRERTEVAIERYRQGDAKEGLKAIETARRLAPDDPRVAYDAGTINLAAGRERKAMELLQQAAEGAPADLAPNAWYNLGNARLAGGDAAAAVEAFERALRLEPGHQDAKWNLELALKERERERLRMRSPQSGPQGDRSGGGSSSDRSGADDPADDRDRESDASDPGQRRGRGGEGEPRQEPQQPEEGRGDRSGLPRFQDQPEMSATEAAALLQAVENLERRQRREEAARRSRERAMEGKDW